MKAKVTHLGLHNTHQLQVGDYVELYGSLFLLTERKAWPNKENPENGDVISFKTKCLYHDKSPGGIPAHWVKDWTIQGNRLARWAKVSIVPMGDEE